MTLEYARAVFEAWLCFGLTMLPVVLLVAWSCRKGGES